MSSYESTGLSLEKLRQNPSGIDLGPLQPQLPERLFTPEKTIRCDTPQCMTDLDRLFKEFQQPGAHTLRLIGRRHVRSNNSWMHNYHRLIKGRDRCTLMMHPQDMADLGIEPGSRVTVSSRVGSVSVAVESTDDMMPGVVSLPHGFGHNRPGIHMQTAAKHAGVSCNDVTDEAYLDALSGNAAVNGVPVTVYTV
jgi:anaerobic selenocysteine-containing dehydrogenase